MNLSLSFGSRSFRISTGGAKAPVQDRGPRQMMRPSGGKRIFEAAQTGRLTADWPITITSADAEILVSALATRARLRQLERDDDYMRSMLTLLENNIIGDLGIRLRIKVRDGSGKLDAIINNAIQDAWSEYLQEENCTVRRNIDGIQLQRFAVRSVARDGGILFRKRRGFANDFRYALEPIEIDRLDHNWNQRAVGTGNEIRFGVELDQWKAPVAYHILTRHPGDVFAYGQSPRYRERVPADEIIALWVIERPEQTIGMPLWPSIAKRLHNIHEYETSEQIAARLGADKAGFFEKTNTSEEYVGEEDSQGNKLHDTAPGEIEELPAGWVFKPNHPDHPAANVPAFIKSQLRGASAGASLPYNSVAQDLEHINYSSYKAGNKEARDQYKWLQSIMTRKLMRHWFRDWLPYAIMSGKLKLPIESVGELRKQDRWKPRRWSGLEPLKEAQANVIAVEAGLDSRRNIIEEDYDRDIEEVFEEQEHDNELMVAHKLFFGNVEKPVIGAEPSDVATDRAHGNGHRNGNGHFKMSRAIGAWPPEREE